MLQLIVSERVIEDGLVFITFTAAAVLPPLE
jgi:hypothetical protein